MSNWAAGLSREQRMKVRSYLPMDITHRGSRTTGDESPLHGWTIYRIPSTGGLPTTLRLHYRNQAGRLSQCISITEDGITK